MQSLVSIWDVPQSDASEILYAGQITASASPTSSTPPTTPSARRRSRHRGDPAAPNAADFATLRISDGDPNVQGDETYYEIPLFPEPNTVVNGQLQNVGDSFQVILNEQTLSPDGNAITVTAAHVRLLGPNVTGDLYIGQVTCGVTSTGTTTTTCGGMAATLVGTPAPDTLTGTDGPDVIVGLGGDDKLFGLEGDDVVCGGGGNDTIEVGAGNDTVSGGAGNDRIVGASGRDLLRGAEGNDSILGGSGNDALDGGPGADTCTGGTGTNTFSGCEG